MNNLLDDVPLGKILGEPNAVYHGRDAVSNTRLKVFAKSPLLYRMLYIDKSIPPKKSEALNMGIAFHARCEGAVVYRKSVVVNDRFEDFKTKESREWRDAQKVAGKTVISPNEAETVRRMVLGFRRNPLAIELLRNTEREVTWRAKVGNFLVQCRTDRWCGAERFIKCLNRTVGPYFVDFKTVQSLSEGDFDVALSNYCYHWQEQFYKQVISQVQGDDLAPVSAYFVVTEKEAPWSTIVYEVDPATKALARSSVLHYLSHLRECYETGIWDLPQKTFLPARLKFWAQKEEELLLTQSPLQLQ